MTRLFGSNKFLITLILVLSFVATWSLFAPGYFPHDDDIQVIRIFEMRRCIQDLQIPCRWVPDMGYGNGFPLYNYYGVLPYYIGALFSYFLGYVYTAKALFFIPLVVGPLGIYFLVRELFDNKAAFAAAVLYMFAPYRAMDVFVRGDISEMFALSIIPFVFYYCLLLIKSNRTRDMLLFAFSLGLFLTNHNIMTMFFMPILLVFVIIFTILYKQKGLLKVLFGGMLGVGLSAFYIVPSYFEKNLVQIQNLLDYGLDFRLHFVTLNQLFFSRVWGFGPSVMGPGDERSFQIGWPQWWVVVALAIVLVWYILAKRFGGFFNKVKLLERDHLTQNNLLLAFLFIALFMFSIFMTHNRSSFVWEALPSLQYAQFPWRFLGVTIFATSLVCGSLVYFVNKKFQLALVLLITVLSICFNFSYFRPKEFLFNVTDQTKFTGEDWQNQQKAIIRDYLPVTANPPQQIATQTPVITLGKGTVYSYNVTSNTWQTDLVMDNQGVVEMPIFDFPIWEIYANGVRIGHQNTNKLGRVQVELMPGKYHIEGRLVDTQIRHFANIVTLGSFIILILYGIFARVYEREFASTFKKRS